MMLWLFIFKFWFCVACVCPGRFSGVKQRLALDESVDGWPFVGRFSPLCWVVLVLVCPVVFESLLWFLSDCHLGV